MSTYYDSQIAALKVDENSVYKPTIKIWGNRGDNKSTNHFSISFDQLEKIRVILNQAAPAAVTAPAERGA
jgi:hypothetical protein